MEKTLDKTFLRIVGKAEADLLASPLTHRNPPPPCHRWSLLSLILAHTREFCFVGSSTHLHPRRNFRYRKKKQKTFHIVLSTVRGIYTRTNKKLKLGHLEYCMHPICIVFCIGMNTSKEKNSEVCDRYA